MAELDIPKAPNNTTEAKLNDQEINTNLSRFKTELNHKGWNVLIIDNEEVVPENDSFATFNNAKYGKSRRISVIVSTNGSKVSEESVSFFVDTIGLTNSKLENLKAEIIMDLRAFTSEPNNHAQYLLQKNLRRSWSIT